MAAVTRKPVKKTAPKVASKAAPGKAKPKPRSKALRDGPEPFVTTPATEPVVESITTDRDASTVVVNIAGGYGREAMLGLSKRIQRAAMEIQ